MKIEYIPHRTGRVYKVRTSIGAEISSYYNLKDAMKDAKEHTRYSGDKAYIYRCLGRTERRR